MKLVLKYLVFVLAIVLTGWVLSGINVDSFYTALWLALFLALVNVTLKPILVILTLPINILTLGLFTLVINAVIILLAESVIKGFAVTNFGWAILFSIVLAIMNYTLGKLFGSK